MTQLAKKDDKVNTLRKWLDTPAVQTQFKRAIRTDITADTVTRIALTSLTRLPALADCTPQSFCGAIVECLQLGLEPDNVSGQAYLIPFKDRKSGTTICTLIPGYRGLIQLAYRSGQVASFEARNVFEGEKFILDWGLDPPIRHTPLPPSQRGEHKGSYAKVAIKGGGLVWDWMWKEEIDLIQARSKAGGSGPWVHKEDKLEMARKSVVRRISKYVPSSPALQRAVSLGDAVDAGLDQNIDIVVDSDAESQPAGSPQSLDDLVEPAPPEPEKPKAVKPKAGKANPKATGQAEELKAHEAERTAIKIAIAEKWNAMSVGQQTAAAKNLNIVGGIQSIDKLPLDELQSIRDGLISAGG